MRYYIFNPDIEYEQGSLIDHLEYLKNWGGTPNIWSSADKIKEAVMIAQSTHFKAVIYDNDSEMILH